MKVMPDEPHQELKDSSLLANFKLVDVVQICCISQKTGRLTIKGQQQEGYIFIKSGVVVHATSHGLEGDEAIYEMLKWDQAQSAFEEGFSNSRVSIDLGWEHLLMEGIRRKDEAIPENNENDLFQPEQLIGKIVGPFHIISMIASDFWGGLYEAVQTSVDRPVALKVLNPNFYKDQEQVQQFVAFAAAMARVQNPYITIVYEAGRGDGYIFYAREHIVESDFKEFLKQGKSLSEDKALRLVIHIGEALRYEKKHSILHTPLIPEQILVPETGIPKLLNNVTMEGSEISPGMLDEIHRLSTIIKHGLKEMKGVSSELMILLDRMEAAGRGGYDDWDIILREAHQLDLTQRSMLAIRPVSSKLTVLPRPSVQRKSWMKWVFLTLGILFLLGVLFWFLFSRSKVNGPVQNLNVMIKIPAGPFIYQADEKFSLPTFYMDSHEVTIGQYRKFLAAWIQNKKGIVEHSEQPPGKDHTPDKWDLILEAVTEKKDFNGTRLDESAPIFNVDFFDAWAYAQWADKRLPTEEEWEKAARGTEGNIYPWGNVLIPKNVNSGADLTDPSNPNFGRWDGFGLWAPVGTVQGDRSPYGVMDMAGNVSEWTSSQIILPESRLGKVAVIRGGSFASLDVKLTLRDVRQSKRKRAQQIGFRCAADQPK